VVTGSDAACPQRARVRERLAPQVAVGDLVVGEDERGALGGAPGRLGEDRGDGQARQSGTVQEPVEPYDGAPVPLENDGVPAT